MFAAGPSISVGIGMVAWPPVTITMLVARAAAPCRGAVGASSSEQRNESPGSGSRCGGWNGMSDLRGAMPR